MRAHAQTLWKSVEVVVLSPVRASCSVTQSWMLSLVSASCIVTTHSCPILNFPLLVPFSSQIQLMTCSQFQLVVRLYQFIITVLVAILCTLLHRENTSFEVWYSHGPQDASPGALFAFRIVARARVPNQHPTQSEVGVQT